MGVYQYVLFPGAYFCIAIILLPFKEQGYFMKGMTLTLPSPLLPFVVTFFLHVFSRIVLIITAA